DEHEGQVIQRHVPELPLIDVVGHRKVAVAVRALGELSDDAGTEVVTATRLEIPASDLPGGGCHRWTSSASTSSGRTPDNVADAFVTSATSAFPGAAGPIRAGRRRGRPARRARRR